MKKKYIPKPKTWEKDLYKYYPDAKTAGEFLEYPEQLIEAFKRVKQGLRLPDYEPTNKDVVEHFLIAMERDAKEKLKEKGYSVELSELYDMDSYKMQIDAASAKSVLFYVGHIRDDIENQDIAQAVLDTMVLLSSFLKVLTYNELWDGTRHTALRKKAGKAPKKKKGIVKMVENFLEEGRYIKSGMMLNYLLENHDSRQGNFAPLFVDGDKYEIYISESKKKNQKGKLAIVLCDKNKSEDTEISKKTFERYVNDIIRERAKHEK